MQHVDSGLQHIGRRSTLGSDLGRPHQQAAVRLYTAASNWGSLTRKAPIHWIA